MQNSSSIEKGLYALSAAAAADFEALPSLQLSKAMKKIMVEDGLRPDTASRLVLHAKIQVSGPLSESHMQQLAKIGAEIFLKAVRASQKAFPELTTEEIVEIIGPQLSLKLD